MSASNSISSLDDLDSLKCLSVAETCALLGITRPTLLRLRNRRRRPLPCIHIGGRALIPKGLLEDWMQREACGRG